MSTNQTTTDKVLVIAEAGVNHNGKPELAFQMVDAAVASGADVIKFQTFTPEAVIAESAPKAAYQQQSTGAEESQLDMVRKLWLSESVFQELASYCQKKDIQFLSTPFDLGSIATLRPLQSQWKIPSGEITNLPFLRSIGKLAQPVILSTGMSTLEEVATALRVLEKAGTANNLVTLLHCTTEYPAPLSSVNLRAMQTLATTFPDSAGVGYSDHTQGIDVAIAAVALGACVIEKHFTLDKTMEGPDHSASLNPSELKAMVLSIRNVATSLGTACKEPSNTEIPNRAIVRKSIVAARNIKAGEILNEKNLTTKRPGTGISPMMWDQIMGTPAKRNYLYDELLSSDQLETTL